MLRYPEDGIETLNTNLGKGLDSKGKLDHRLQDVKQSNKI